MRRILILLVGAGVLALPVVAAARTHASRPAPGFLVVRNGSADDGINGSPVATVVVQGFVLGRIAQEGAVELYHLSGTSAPQAVGADLSRSTVYYNHHSVSGVRFSGSGFRFRVAGGVWRVVVYGAGVSLYAGGEGKVAVHGRAAYPDEDGTYSLNGGAFASLPTGVFKGTLGAK